MLVATSFSRRPQRGQPQRFCREPCAISRGRAVAGLFEAGWAAHEMETPKAALSKRHSGLTAKIATSKNRPPPSSAKADGGLRRHPHERHPLSPTAPFGRNEASAPWPISRDRTNTSFSKSSPNTPFTPPLTPSSWNKPTMRSKRCGPESSRAPPR